MTPEQETELRAQAEQAGIDPDQAVRIAKSLEAERESTDKPKTEASDAPDAAPAELPKLFQYHLPFVTVREVRQKWLGLTDAFPGDNEVAAMWSAKMGGGGSAPPDAAPAA